MKSQTRKQALVWGSLLILFGVITLVETFTDLTAWTWVALLAAAGLGVFAVYLTDRSDRGLLIPAYVMWAIAGLIALITALFVLQIPKIRIDTDPENMLPEDEAVRVYHNEVKDHILHDHPEHAAVVDSIEPHEMPHD